MILKKISSEGIIGIPLIRYATNLKRYRMISIRLICLSGFLLLLSSQLSAQHTVSLQGGASDPAGDLSRTYPGYYGYSGHAATGAGLTFQYNYQVQELVAIVATGSYQAFPLDQDAIKQQAGAEDLTFTNEPSTHNLWTAMAGPALTFASGPFKARLKIQAGYMHLNMTGFSYQARYENTRPPQSEIKQSGNESGSLGLSAGMDFRYALTDRFGINLSANVVHGQFDQRLSVTRDRNQEPRKVNGPGAITAIQPMLGLSADL